VSTPLTSMEVYHWPEFKALCKRLGIDWEEGTKTLSIQIGPDPEDPVRVVHEYQVRSKDEMIDTTIRHNRKWRTGLPAEGPDIHTVLSQEQ
jgi:hypothetical protein